MLKKVVALLVAFLVAVATAGCGADNAPESNAEDGVPRPSLFGVSLGDSREVVQEKLGREYQETEYEEAGHFPEVFCTWDYTDGTTVYIGRESGNVMEIRSTAPDATTNLGVKIGDTAESVFAIYRERYTEPESIHGGVLTGVFKVEDGAAVVFDFDMEDGIVNPSGVDADETLKRIILTYPSHVDDDF